MTAENLTYEKAYLQLMSRSVRLANTNTKNGYTRFRCNNEDCNWDGHIYEAEKGGAVVCYDPPHTGKDCRPNELSPERHVQRAINLDCKERDDLPTSSSPPQGFSLRDPIRPRQEMSTRENRRHTDVTKKKDAPFELVNNAKKVKNEAATPATPTASETTSTERLRLAMTERQILSRLTTKDSAALAGRSPLPPPGPLITPTLGQQLEGIQPKFAALHNNSKVHEELEQYEKERAAALVQVKNEAATPATPTAAETASTEAAVTTEPLTEPKVESMDTKQSSATTAAVSTDSATEEVAPAADAPADDASASIDAPAPIADETPMEVSEALAVPDN